MALTTGKSFGTAENKLEDKFKKWLLTSCTLISILQSDRSSQIVEQPHLIMQAASIIAKQWHSNYLCGWRHVREYTITVHKISAYSGSSHIKHLSKYIMHGTLIIAKYWYVITCVACAMSEINHHILVAMRGGGVTHGIWSFVQHVLRTSYLSSQHLQTDEYWGMTSVVNMVKYTSCANAALIIGTQNHSSNFMIIHPRNSSAASIRNPISGDIATV